MSQFQDLLNALIKAKLPEINSAISGAIKSQGLDPMRSVASGSDKIGSIDLGICTASATASYALQNLTGLSSFHVNSLIITSATTTEDGTGMHGTVALDANLKSNVGIHVGGKFRAGCGFLKPSVGIGGQITMSSISIKAGGDFEASIGEKICLTEVDITNPGLNYGNINVDIDGLGIFNSLLHPLENFILGLVKGQVISLMESSITPPINSALKGFLPQCTSL
ncbi:hypothetical protein [Marinifilum flexuosum]|uniref:hypothetical protein n=1 Tax=Marinifilum flexuosum TaxID=1117708 RepID=UPI002493DD75|nr:hypothetical protein [Marinifilum flexuosum]